MNVICTRICVYIASRYLLPRRSYFIKSTRWYSSLHNMTDSTHLSQFLSSSKDRYLIDLRHGKGRNWTVVMGNEAGGKSDQFLTKRSSQLPLRSRFRRVRHCIRMDPI